MKQTDTSSISDRDEAIRALQQAGLLRPVSADLVARYARLEPDQRATVRRELAERRFFPSLSEQIIKDRGEDGSPGAAMAAGAEGSEDRESESALTGSPGQERPPCS
jgi:hypothetical protein